jgi:AAA domain
MNRLPVAPAHTLAERAEEQRWLVDRLWSEEAVGIIGGEPKCCKSFLALDLAVSIAAGTPCLRRFAVQRPGRVLLYAAEMPCISCGAGSTVSAPPPAAISPISMSR